MLRFINEFRINSHDSRYKVVTGLIEAGYAVEVKERQRPQTCIGTDHFVRVYSHVEEAKCPDGYPRKLDKVDLYEMIE